jgi:hypothetical protein
MHEHDIVMDLALGRRLFPTECIHHKNGNKMDNRLENLELMEHVEHSRMHNIILSKDKKRDAGRFA